jgi:transposase-like protein
MKKEKNNEYESLLASLPEDIFGQFKTMRELDSFLGNLFKRGVEKMLETELTDHLGYDKTDPGGNGSGNSKNGKTRKLIKSQNGEVIIEVPRDRNSDFEPVVVPKHQKVIEKIEALSYLCTQGGCRRVI